MKIFYISEVDGETCYLKTLTGLFDTEMTITDLHEFSKNNKVVGYNPVTYKVEVKTEESIFEFINTKRKLSGKDPIGDTASVSYKAEGNTVTVSVEDIYDTRCLYSTIFYSWKKIVEAYEKETNNIKSKGDIVVKLDLPSVIGLYSNGSWYRESQSGKKYNITLICVNKDMLKDTKDVGNLVSINHHLVDSFEADFSICEFNPECTTVDMFDGFIALSDNKGNIFRNLKVHDSFYNCYAHYSLIETQYFPSLKGSLKELAKKTKGKYVEVRLNCAHKMKYSNLIEIIKENPDMKINMDSDYFYIDRPISVMNDKIQPLADNVTVSTSNVGFKEDFDIDIDYEDIQSVLNLIDAETSTKKKYRVYRDIYDYDYDLHNKKEDILNDNYVVHDESKANIYETYLNLLNTEKFLKFMRCMKGLDFKGFPTVDCIDLTKAKFMAYLLSPFYTKHFIICNNNPINILARYQSSNKY